MKLDQLARGVAGALASACGDMAAEPFERGHVVTTRVSWRGQLVILLLVSSPKSPHSNLVGAAGVAEIGVREQCIKRQHLADHALLEGVAQHGLEVLAVGCG